MLSFWLTIIAMLALAAGIVILPLLKPRSADGVSRDELNAAIFQERLVELDAELREGRIDKEQYWQIREDMERTLLVDVPAGAGQQTPRNRLSVLLSACVAGAVLLIAFGYYYASSYRGDVQEWIALQDRLQTAVEKSFYQGLPPEVQADLPGFTRVLQSKMLREGMSDPEGLYILGVSYLRLQMPQTALNALSRAFELDPHRPDIMLATAHAVILNNDGRLTDGSYQLLQGVLRADPDNQQALMLLGFGYFNNGAFEEALKIWRPLAATLDPKSEGGRLIGRLIARAEQGLTAHAQIPASEKVSETASKTAAVNAPSIAVTVELSPDLEQRLAPQDTLFIFAKAVAGPPMPLAAVRQPARDFPVQVVLDDSRAMLPNMKLSNFQEVVVGARISKGGGPGARPGDLQGKSPVLSLKQGPQAVSLLIDQVVQ